ESADRGKAHRTQRDAAAREHDPCGEPREHVDADPVREIAVHCQPIAHRVRANDALRRARAGSKPLGRHASARTSTTAATDTRCNAGSTAATMTSTAAMQYAASTQPGSDARPPS